MVTPARILLHCNKRCDERNLIAELKSGVGSLCVLSDALLSNGASMLIKPLAGALKSWAALLLPIAARQKACSDPKRIARRPNRCQLRQNRRQLNRSAEGRGWTAAHRRDASKRRKVRLFEDRCAGCTSCVSAEADLSVGQILRRAAAAISGRWRATSTSTVEHGGMNRLHFIVKRR